MINRNIRILASFLMMILHKCLLNKFNNWRNSKKSKRFIEFGPGFNRIDGFENANIKWGRRIEYVIDLGEALPFSSGSFDLIYASHVLEHLPWYRSRDVLNEWVRVLKRDGWLEVWVPDGLKIARAFVDAEQRGALDFKNDGWWRYNPDRDPCVWMAGRTYAYGNGSGKTKHPNWHRALFSERYLMSVMKEGGLVDLRRMERSEVRGHDHGWINLGIRGRKA